MRNHKAFLLAAIVLMTNSIAGADLILTLNGNDLSDSPLISSMGQFLVAVEGSTEIGPNDVSVGAVGGALDPVPDANNEYYFEFDANSNEATISLVTTIDMVIDGNSIPAGATIYQLLIFCNRQQNIFGAVGIGLDELIWSEGQSASSPDSRTFVASEDTSALEATRTDSVTTPVSWIEALASGRPTQQEERVLLDCPVDTSESKREESEAECSESVSVEHAATPESPSGGSSSGGLMTMGAESVIEVNSDITSNQIWTSDNTYHIITDVNVQALLVIEPGTMVAFGPEKGLFVNNGGALVSRGTPHNPVIYTSDSQDPWYGDYSCAVFIEETASVATKITYSYIEYAYAGIVISNRRLDAPIENNYFFNNAYGIVDQGIEHTDISNNLIVASYYNGIEVFLESATGQADANSHILIQNNTCDYYQDCGITVHGVPNIEDAGSVILANNLVSESYQFGLNLVDGYMYATVLNTGYYDNAYNKNWEFEESDPVIEIQWPYQDGTGSLPICYLDQNSAFIDAGYEYIEQSRLIGKTTDINSSPDCNKTDIGFHYPNWGFSNAGEGNILAADIDGDLIVNFDDFAILGNGWGATYDFADLSEMAGEWLDTVSAHPNISVIISGDPNNVNGAITVEVANYAPATDQAFAFIDGEFVQEIIDFEDAYGIGLDTCNFKNGQHFIKVVTVESNNLVTVSPALGVTFNNPLYCIAASDGFAADEDYQIGAFYSGTDTLSLKVIDINEDVVWSNVYAGHINAAIPAGTLGDDGFYEVVVEKVDGGTLGTMGSSDFEEWRKRFSKKFDAASANPNMQVLIVSPDKKVTEGNFQCIQAAITAFQRRGIRGTVLYGANASYENVAFCLTHRPVKYLYFVGHGSYEVAGKLRTVIALFDARVVSYKRADFDPNNVPGFCEDLGRWETKVKSMFAVGIPPGKLKIVFLDSCYTGRLKFTAAGDLIQGPNYEEYPIDLAQGDMAGALQMWYADQIYKGWYGKSITSDFLFYYNSWSSNFWNELGYGDSVYQALMDTIDKTPGGELEYGPHQNYRLRNFGDIMSIRLER